MQALVRPNRPLITSELCENSLDIVSQGWEVSLDRHPHSLDVDPEVVVGKDVAQRNHLTPWNFRMLFSKTIGEAASGLSEDFHVMDDPRLDQLVSLDGVASSL